MTCRQIQPGARLTYHWLFVLAIAASGILLANQGWNSRFISFDMLGYIDDAQRFIDHGHIPEKGILTSFASYSPPGITWLFIPGTYAFTDPRIFESIGAGILYTGTLAGLFLLARPAFGLVCAYLTVTLWGLSDLGLRFADTTGARGHPFFYIWMLYLAGLWIGRKDSKYLILAIVVWAVGMYCMMEIAPAIMIIPVVWLYFRPPLKVSAIIAAGVLSGIIWLPYLRFEVTRGFLDIKSQIARQKILPTDFEKTWCNPGLLPASWVANRGLSGSSDNVIDSIPDQPSLALGLAAVFSRAKIVLSKLLIANHAQASRFPGASIFLLVVTIVTMLVCGASPSSAPPRTLHRNRRSIWLKWFGVGLIFCSLAFNELTMAFLSPDGALQPSTVLIIRIFQLVCFTCALILLTVRETIVAVISRLWQTSSLLPSEASNSTGRKFVAIALAVPWLILLLLTEEASPQRFWWLWPLQIMTLAGAVTYFPNRFNWPRFWVWTGSLVLAFMLLSTELLASRLTGWARDGWLGKESDEIRVIDLVARLIESERTETAAIGYSILVSRFMATFNAADLRYKVGADFNVFFKSRHGILNTNDCPEGISPNDNYRIAQSYQEASAGQGYIPAPVDTRFRTVAEVGSYRILKRVRAGKIPNNDV